MPTLLKNSAAEGYKMGAASHEAELDRDEAARQNDLNRYERARANSVKSLIDMYGSNNFQNFSKFMIGRKGNPTPVYEAIRDAANTNVETFAPVNDIYANPDRTFSMRNYKENRQDKYGGTNYGQGKK